jgi:hypothetical protein
MHFWHKNPIMAHEWLEDVMPDRIKRLRLMSLSGAGSREYKLLKVALKKELEDELRKSNVS